VIHGARAETGQNACSAVRTCRGRGPARGEAPFAFSVIVRSCEIDPGLAFAVTTPRSLAISKEPLAFSIGSSGDFLMPMRRTDVA